MISDAPAEDGRATGAARIVPGLVVARTYRRSWLRSDLVAGVVLAAIMVPQGMAYAELAGLPPVTGLYTTIACLVAYAIMGPSRVIVLGAVIEIVLGKADLGFIADLLSKEVQVGYMNGLAITIVVGQLPKLCGFSTDADGFVDELRAFVRDFGERDRTTLLLGLTTLAVLLVLPRISRRVPAVLVAVVGSTVVTAVFGLAVKTVGPLPQGLPHPAFPWTG